MIFKQTLTRNLFDFITDELFCVYLFCISYAFCVNNLKSNEFNRFVFFSGYNSYVIYYAMLIRTVRSIQSI